MRFVKYIRHFQEKGEVALEDHLVPEGGRFKAKKQKRHVQNRYMRVYSGSQRPSLELKTIAIVSYGSRETFAGRPLQWRT